MLPAHSSCDGPSYYYPSDMLNNYVEENSQYECCNIILPAEKGRGVLLLGDFNSAIDSKLLQELDVKTIITAASGLQHIQVQPHITHITYPVADLKSQKISTFFDQSYATIQNSITRGGVLVHCAAGVSRSATIVIAYLMKKLRFLFRQAIAFVKGCRSIVCPNLGFEMQLKHYERLLFGQVKGNRVCKTLVPNKMMIEFMERPEKKPKDSNIERFPEIKISKTSVRKKRELGKVFDLQQQKIAGRMTSHTRNSPTQLLISPPGFSSCLSRNRDSIIQEKPNSIHVSRKIYESRQLDSKPQSCLNSSRWICDFRQSSNYKPLNKAQIRSSLIRNLRK